VKKRRSRPQRNRVLATMLLMAGTHAALAAGPGEKELVVFQTRAAVSIDACEDDAPDVMVAGGVYEIGKGRRLLTPLSG